MTCGRFLKTKGSGHVWAENVTPCLVPPCTQKTPTKHNLIQLQTTENTEGNWFPKPLVGGSTPPGAPMLSVHLHGYQRLSAESVAPSAVLYCFQRYCHGLLVTR